MCDTDFENSSFDSEESTESFETHPNAFTQNVEIPDCMDWSVHQLYQYLSDRGLSKLITDKIIENVNKVDKKSQCIFIFITYFI